MVGLVPVLVGHHRASPIGRQSAQTPGRQTRPPRRRHHHDHRVGEPGVAPIRAGRARLQVAHHVPGSVGGVDDLPYRIDRTAMEALGPVDLVTGEVPNPVGSLKAEALGRGGGGDARSQPPTVEGTLSRRDRHPEEPTIDRRQAQAPSQARASAIRSCHHWSRVNVGHPGARASRWGLYGPHRAGFFAASHARRTRIGGVHGTYRTWWSRGVKSGRGKRPPLLPSVSPGAIL